jgi:hypothetical protein
MNIDGFPEPEVQPASAPTQAKPRRSRWDVALALGCLALLAVAGVLAARARTSSSDAHAARAQASTLDRQRAALTVTDRHDEHETSQITSATSDLTSAMEKLSTDFGAVVDAQNHFVDVANQSATSFNRGGVSAAVGELKSQGQAALADVTAKQAVVDADLVAAQAAITHLEGVLHG